MLLHPGTVVPLLLARLVGRDCSAQESMKRRGLQAGTNSGAVFLHARSTSATINEIQYLSDRTVSLTLQFVASQQSIAKFFCKSPKSSHLSKTTTCEVPTSPLTQRNGKEDFAKINCNRAGRILSVTSTHLPSEEVKQQDSVAAIRDQKIESQNDCSVMENHAPLNTGSGQAAMSDQTSQDALESHEDSSQIITSFDSHASFNTGSGQVTRSDQTCQEAREDSSQTNESLDNSCSHDRKLDKPPYYMMSHPRLAQSFSSTGTADSINDSDDEDSDDSDLPVFTEAVHPAKTSISTKMDIGKPQTLQNAIGETKTALKVAATHTKDKGSASGSGKGRHYQTSTKYGLDNLVHRKCSETELAEIMSKLKDDLKTSGGVGVEIRQEVAKEKILDTTQDESDEDILPEHQEQMLKLNHRSTDIPQGIPGEVVFGEGPMKDLSSVLPDRSHPPIDAMEKRLHEACAAGLRELVCGSWLHYYYLAKPCPDHIVRWLFCFMCNQRDQHVVTKAFQTLWSWMELGKQSVRSGSNWTPSVATVCQILCGYGTEYRLLLPPVDNEPLIFSQFRSDCVLYLSCENRTAIPEDDTEMKDVSAKQELPVFAFSRLLQTLTHSLQLRQDSLSECEVFGLVVVVSRCSLDLHCSGVVSDMGELVSVLMDCFTEDDWLLRTRELCHVLSQTSRNYRNLLHIANMLIGKGRSRALQQLLSYKLLCELHMEAASLPKYRDFVPFEETSEKIKIKWLHPLVSAWSPKTVTDYHLLYTWINLLDLCVGAEQPAKEEREDMEMLRQLLFKLQSLIRDDQGRFMDRVKTKDLIVLMVGKFSVLTQHKGAFQLKMDDLFTTSREYKPELKTL